MVELPQCFHDVATALTLAGASVWLALRVVRISQPQGGEPGCARCDRSALAPGPELGGPATGRRSKQLRVIG